MRISDWSSDVCSSDLLLEAGRLPLVRERIHLQEGVVGRLLNLDEVRDRGNLGNAPVIFADALATGERRVGHARLISTTAPEAGRPSSAAPAANLRVCDPVSADPITG